MADLIYELQHLYDKQTSYTYKNKEIGALQYIKDVAEGKVQPPSSEITYIDDYADIDYEITEKQINVPSRQMSQDSLPIYALSPIMLRLNMFTPEFGMDYKNTNDAAAREKALHAAVTRAFYRDNDKLPAYEAGCLAFALHSMGKHLNLPEPEIQAQINKYVNDNPLYKDMLNTDDNREWAENILTKVDDYCKVTNRDWHVMPVC